MTSIAPGDRSLSTSDQSTEEYEEMKASQS